MEQELHVDSVNPGQAFSIVGRVPVIVGMTTDE
jgi:hypothetical protein